MLSYRKRNGWCGMLVSLMSMYNAINMRNNAVLGMMHCHNTSLSFLGNTSPEQANLEFLHEQDTKNSLEMVNHQLMYKIAEAQEEQSKALLKEEIENDKLNFLA